MPSVEMRRSTRVFVPKAKDGEFVRVLRSGRRLSVDLADVKNHHHHHQEQEHRGGGGVKHADGDEWFPLMNDCKIASAALALPVPQKNGWHEARPKREQKAKVQLVDVVKEDNLKTLLCLTPARSSSEVKMFRNVYSRKRKRNSSDVDVNQRGKKFGLHFVRRQRRRSEKKEREERMEELGVENGVLSIVVESKGTGCYLSSRLLGSVLRHLGSGCVGLAQLSAFLVLAPFSDVFASFGIRFLWDRPSMMSRGLCRVFGEMQSTPLFAVDFSAIPLCFLQLHSALSFRSVRLCCLSWMTFVESNESIDYVECIPCIDTQSEHLLSTLVAPVTEEPKDMEIDKDDSVNMESLSSTLGSGLYVAGQNQHSPSNLVVLSLSSPAFPDKDGMKSMRIANSPSRNGKLGSRHVQYRIGVTTRSASKRRRRSLRSRRARNPSPFVMQKSSGPPVSDHVAVRKNVGQLPLSRNQEPRRSTRRSSATEINVTKSDSVADLNVEVDLQQSCSANLLVVETDICYRVEGADVMLEFSPSNEWVLAVKKDGSLRCCLKVQKEMRPSTTNRFTHAVVWAAENGWKLEFPDRKDWILFKELYKVCGEKNVVPTSPVVKIIPVPGVTEVINPWDSTNAPFVRPESYIRMTSDELSKTLSSRTVNYDMDSEDEEWLSKFNSGLDEACVLTEETFELMIDAFEKASYCTPENVSDEKAAAGLYLHLASPEVGEPVYRYWMKKRKQKRTPLLRVFELNQPKRQQLSNKPVLRKRRSMKRTTVQQTQRGRGKDNSVLQAIAAERSAAEEQIAVLRLQEAKASADRSVELAICKRQRAQFLMENADLAMYRATMALRIADAAAQVIDYQQAAAHFLDSDITGL